MPCTEAEDLLDRPSARADLNGANIVTVVQPAFDAVAVDIDLVANKIYWVANFVVTRANLDGTHEEHLFTTKGGSRRIALDLPNERMFVIDYTIGRILRVDFSPPAGLNLQVAVESPHDIVLDPVARRLYFVDSPLHFGTPRIARADVDGSNFQPILDSDFLRLTGIAFDPNPSAVCPGADNDGFCDAADNCPGVSNHSQADLDGDGVGDACEAAIPTVSQWDC